MLFRSMGSAVGVAAFGAVVDATLGAASLESATVDAGALADAVHHVFVATAAVSVLLLIAVLLLPRDDRPEPAGA
jgi:hypothetical protein